MSLIVFGVAFGCIETGSGRIYILSGNSVWDHWCYISCLRIKSQL